MEKVNKRNQSVRSATSVQQMCSQMPAENKGPFGPVHVHIALK